MKKLLVRIILPAALTAGVCLPALAHPGADHAHAAGWSAALLAGFAHPFTGLDHLLALFAAGLWSARQPGGRSFLPLFLGAMLIGALSGVAGLAIPGLESGIAATVVLAGVLVAAAARLPAAAGMCAVALFALLHGNAHGHELPLAWSAAGFLSASGMLILLGRMAGSMITTVPLRMAGAGVATAGMVMLLS